MIQHFGQHERDCERCNRANRQYAAWATHIQKHADHTIVLTRYDANTDWSYIACMGCDWERSDR